MSVTLRPGPPTVAAPLLSYLSPSSSLSHSLTHPLSHSLTHPLSLSLSLARSTPHPPPDLCVYSVRSRGCGL